MGDVYYLLCFRQVLTVFFLLSWLKYFQFLPFHQPGGKGLIPTGWQHISCVLLSLCDFKHVLGHGEPPLP